MSRTRILTMLLLLAVCFLMGVAAAQIPEDSAALLAEAERLSDEMPALYRSGRFNEALANARRALAIREQILGPEHLDTADSLNYLGVVLWELGKPAEARPLLERALAIRREKLEPDHPNLAESLGNLGAVLLALGEIQNATPLLEQAAQRWAQAFGCAHPETLRSLTNLAFAIQAGGDLEKAKSLLEQVLALRQATRGEADVETLSILNNLGGLHLELGQLAEARSYFERTLRLSETALGPEHPRTIQVLENLGGVFNETGELHEAKRHFERALAILMKIRPPEHPEIAKGLSNVGGTLLKMGDGEGARLYYERALAISEKVYGPRHPATAQSLNNLALALMRLDDWAGAKSLLERALDIDEQILGPDHPETALQLSNLGTLLMETGELERARPLLERALSIHEAKPGPHHPATATNLDNLGVLLLAQGKRGEARPMLERSLAIRSASLGKQHPDTVISLHNLAASLELEGATDRAIALEELALEGEERSLHALLVIGSETEKELFLRTLSSSAHSVVSLHVQAAPDKPRALRLALNTILRRKGRVLDSTVEGLRRARKSQDPRDLQLFERLRDLRESWAFLFLRPPQSMTSDDRSRRIEELNREIRKAASELSERHPAYQQEDPPVDVDTVQARLTGNGALVEFFVYKPWKPGTGVFTTWWEKPRYVVYVLRAAGPPRWVDLGPAEAIDQAVEEFRHSLAQVRPDVQERGRDLDALTMARVRPLLEGAEDLVLSPDGSLQLIPFAALVDEEGRYLVERYGLHYVTSGRDLLRDNKADASREEGLLVGDVDFDASPEPREDGGEAMRSAAMGSLHLERIAATGEEVRSIGALLGLPRERVLTGTAATEQAVKRVHGPEILHIASHGFFLPEVPASEGSGPIGPQLPRPIPEDPLLRSGLALSGFNRRLQSRSPDDGVLTALEAADLDLWGTGLVVLSACETGLGDVRTGEGVFGLRRALLLAGSQAQGMSLWQVPDVATKDLMVSWYEQMLRGAPKAEALRSIQLAALAGEPLPKTGRLLRGTRRLDESTAVARLAGSRHPFYWAGWILSGDPGPLPLKRVRRSGRAEAR